MTTDKQLDRQIKKLQRQIQREKIRAHGPGQYVDRCHFSKTGWAIWTEDYTCTCKPAHQPENPIKTANRGIEC